VKLAICVFSDAFSWGADDVLTLSSTRPLLTRLRTLPREMGTLPASARGTALIAESDKARRTVVGPRAAQRGLFGDIAR